MPSLSQIFCIGAALIILILIVNLAQTRSKCAVQRQMFSRNARKLEAEIGAIEDMMHAQKMELIQAKNDRRRCVKRLADTQLKSEANERKKYGELSALYVRLESMNVLAQEKSDLIEEVKNLQTQGITDRETIDELEKYVLELEEKLKKAEVVQVQNREEAFIDEKKPPDISKDNLQTANKDTGQIRKEKNEKITEKPQRILTKSEANVDVGINMDHKVENIGVEDTEIKVDGQDGKVQSNVEKQLNELEHMATEKEEVNEAREDVDKLNENEKIEKNLQNLEEQLQVIEPVENMVNKDDINGKDNEIDPGEQGYELLPDPNVEGNDLDKGNDFGQNNVAEMNINNDDPDNGNDFVEIIGNNDNLENGDGLAREEAVDIAENNNNLENGNNFEQDEVMEIIQNNDDLENGNDFGQNKDAERAGNNDQIIELFPQKDPKN